VEPGKRTGILKGEELLTRNKLNHFLLGTILTLSAFATGTRIIAETTLTADKILANVAEKNRQRAASLKSYTSKRTYHLQYHGFPASKEAEMLVEVQFNAPSTKEFHIISEKGSKFVINHVLRNLLTAEQEAMDKQNQQQTAMTADNYSFVLEREESADNHHYYVMQAQPKRKNKFLFRGQVWIDADNFAVARIDAEPAKNPSFWISKTRIMHQYIQVGEFWLPARNVSQTRVRLGGTATLTIDYGDYVIPSQPDPEPKQEISYSP
jgi:hypothetical protein